MKKRGYFLLFIAVLFLSLSCTNESVPLPEVSKPPLPQVIEAETVTMLMFNDNGQMDRIAGLVNNLLADYGYPVRLRFDVQPMEKYMNIRQQYNAPYLDEVMEYDLFYEGIGFNSQIIDLIDRNIAADLTDILTRHEDLFTTIPSSFWKEVTIDGRIYAVPTGNTGHSEGVFDTGVMIRSDIVKSLGAEMPKSPTELLELALRAKEAGLEYKVAYCPMYPPHAFHRTYSEWPFFVDKRSLFIMTKDGGLDAYPYSEIYEKDTAILSEFMKNGVLYSVTSPNVPQAQKTWNFMAALPYIMYDIDTPHFEDIQVVQFAPEKANFLLQPTNNMRIYVSSQSQKKEAAVTLLEAIYTHQDIHDAFNLGEEGVDWKLYDDGSYEILQDTNIWLRLFKWRRPYHGYTEITPALSLPAQEGTLIEFPGTGFQYTPKNQLAWQSVLGYFSSTVYNVRMGVSSYRSNEEAIDRMRMGLDTSEYQKILDGAREQYLRYKLD